MRAKVASIFNEKYSFGYVDSIMFIKVSIISAYDNYDITQWHILFSMFSLPAGNIFLSNGMSSYS